MEKKQRKPTIRIEAIDQKNKGDKRLAKILEKMVQAEADELMPIVEAIASAKQHYILLFGESLYTLDDRPWNRIMEAVVKLKISLTHLKAYKPLIKALYETTK